MTETKKPRTPKTPKTVNPNTEISERKQMTINPSPEIREEILAFLHNAGPTLRRMILASSVLPSGEPQGTEMQSFLAYAIRLALNKPSPQKAGKLFGEKIEQDVLKIMDQNLVAHDNGEPWNVTAIGTGTLRDLNNNPNSVKRWIEENAKRLAEHHAAVGIKPEELADWNRKQGVYRNRLQKEGK